MMKLINQTIPNSNPAVSVVIATYNGKHFLQECLTSILDQTFKDYEIIIVDNGSSDGTLEYLNENFPSVIVIKNKTNLGFAEAYNQGMEKARGKYVVTLNNDTKADASWLKELVAVAEENKAVGMVASKILSYGDKKTIDSVGIKISLDGMSRGKGRLETDIGQYNDEKEILLPSACAALYKKEMLDQVGLFDKDFFAYCEDTDLGLRGRLAGWKAVFASSAVIYHKYSGTSGKYSPFKAYLVERNHAWLVLKNFPIELVILFPFFTTHRLIMQFFAGSMGKGAAARFLEKASFWHVVKTLISAYWGALLGLPEILKKRRAIQKQKCINRNEFYKLLTQFNLPFWELVSKN